MVDPGERVSITLKREFLEEALNVNEASGTEKHHIDISIEHFFDGGEEVKYLSAGGFLKSQSRVLCSIAS